MNAVPQTWRAFARAEPVAAQRAQSLAFLLAEGLGAVPLKGGTKIMLPPSTEDVRNWPDPDVLPFINFAAPLKQSPAEAWSDLDLDQDPVGEWTEALRAEANRHQRDLAAALHAFGPVDAPAFGRASMGARGHHIVHIATLTPEETAAIRRFGMIRPIPIGGLLLRLEVRLAAQGKSDPSSKAFTLPGSVYLGEDGRYDLICWQAPQARETAKIGLTGASVLHKALYAFLFTAVARPHWTEHNRHNAALYFAGLLAHEVMAGFLTEDEARKVWDFALDRLGDPDRKDRDKVLADSLTAIARKAPVSGYTRLAELVGPEAQLALLRMRGGSDPDAVTEMYRRIIAVRNGLTERDVYVDLSGGAELYSEVPAKKMAQRYSNHPDFPPFLGKKDTKVEIIWVVLNSSRIQRVHGVVQMPGSPYGARFYKDGERFILVSDETPAPDGAPIYLNASAGLPDFDTPTEAEVEAWRDLWDRHLDPLTCNEDKQYEQIEQAIAHKIQDPQRKFPLGIALCGDQGIGKSALFDVILRELYGDQIIGRTTGIDLRERFRLQTLGGALFYVIEEVDFVGLDPQMHELFKNLTKNSVMPVEHKYGRKGTDRNVAIPWFLTNSDDPRIIIGGKPERSLSVVQGITHRARGGSMSSWAAYMREIEANVADFAKRLRSEPRLRNAGRHYFATLPLNYDIFANLILDTPSGHLRASMSPLDQCLVDILETDMIRPGKPDWPISGAFSFAMLRLGLEERMKARGVRPGELNEARIGTMLRNLFNVDVILTKQIRVKDNTGTSRVARLRYLKYRMQYLHKLIKENRGLELTALYEFDAGEPIEADEPSKQAFEAAWEKSLSPLSNGMY